MGIRACLECLLIKRLRVGVGGWVFSTSVEMTFESTLELTLELTFELTLELALELALGLAFLFLRLRSRSAGTAGMVGGKE